jgi:hypothetical protein
MRKWLAFALGCSVLLIAVACGDDTVELPTPSPTTDAAASPTPVASGSPSTVDGAPSIGMNAPGEGATVAPGNVKTSVIVSGFDLVDELGEKNKKGEGHVVFYLDVAELPDDPDEPAFVDDEAKYFATPSLEHTWTITDVGEHTLSAQLVNNDHTPLDPPLSSSITITVVDQPEGE